MSSSNSTPNFYFNGHWDNVHEWFERNDQMTAPKRADADDIHRETLEDIEERACSKKCANQKNKKYIHVPHSEKPPQVVAKRNARERKRVQAVNCAFSKLRKAIPLNNNRGKRVSKVKTLKYAIMYIHKLQELLNEVPYEINFYNYTSSGDVFDKHDYEDF